MPVRPLIALLAWSLAPLALADDALDLDEPSFDVAEDDDFDLGDDFGQPAKDSKKGKGKAPAPTEEGEDPDEGPTGYDEDPDWDAPADPDLRDSDDPGEDADDPAEDDEPTTTAAEADDEDPVEDLRPAKAPSAPPKAAVKAPPAPKAAPAVSAAPDPGLSFDDKEPLADNFPVTVVSKDLDSVVVELPVLISAGGSNRADADYWLVAEIVVGKKKVGETRYLVNAASLSDLGPTVVWVKSSVPVHEDRGLVEVKVSRIDGDADPRVLFARTVDYRL